MAISGGCTGLDWGRDPSSTECDCRLKAVSTLRPVQGHLQGGVGISQETVVVRQRLGRHRGAQSCRPRDKALSDGPGFCSDTQMFLGCFFLN